MSDRVKRERKPVNYNEKEAGSMVPAWAAEVNYNGGSPASDKNKSLKKRPAAEKENAKQTAKPSKASKPAKKEDKEVPKDSPEKDIKPQKRSKKEKEPAVAERGKNAGLKILPIADQRTDAAPKVAGLREQQAPEDSEPADSELPSPPSNPREVPGLPGIVLQGRKATAKPPAAAASKKGSGSGAGSSKRKASSSSAATPASTSIKKKGVNKKQVVVSEDEASDVEEEEEEEELQQKPQKRQRQQQQQPPAPAPIIAAAAVAPRPQQRATRADAAAAAPLPAALLEDHQPMTFSPLPATDLEQELAVMSGNAREWMEKCARLEQENEELKRTKIAEEVQRLLEEQNERVREHGEAAAALAGHWKEEAERLKQLIEEFGSEEAKESHRKLMEDLKTCQQALLDYEAARADREKTVVHLEKRNVHLERYARVYTTADKCVGTSGPAQADAYIQVPSNSGLQMLEARAMAPEGADGSTLYYDRQHHQGMQTQTEAAAWQATYTLAAQQTMQRGGRGFVTGSDMELVSSGPQGGRAAGPQGGVNRGGAGAGGHANDFEFDQHRPTAMPGRRASISHLTAESNMHNAGVGVGGTAAGNRRLSAPVGPTYINNGTMSRGAGPSGFNNNMSNNGSRGGGGFAGGLAPVPEDISLSQQGGAVDGAATFSGSQQQQQQQQYQPSSSGPMLPRDAALGLLTGLESTPVKGNKFMYIHRGSGYQFELGPNPDADDNDPESEDYYDMKYTPIMLGIAQEVLEKYSGLGTALTDKDGFCYNGHQQEMLMQGIMRALAMLNN